MKLVLHNYWRSSASQRVRIGLHLKGLRFEYVAVNIAKNDQHGDGFRGTNPMGQVPALVITEGDGTSHVLVQSLPILEYLDERFPDVPLLPKDPLARARARALAETVNSGIQPHQNLTTTRKLDALGVPSADWPRSFIAEGLAAYARLAAPTMGAFSVGDAPTIADLCLVPQLLSARRFHVPLDPEGPLGALLVIEQHCLELSAFSAAAPDQQPDATK